MNIVSIGDGVRDKLSYSVTKHAVVGPTCPLTIDYSQISVGFNYVGVSLVKFRIAEHLKPDYSAAYVVFSVNRNDGTKGHGLTIGRGTDIVVATVEALRTVRRQSNKIQEASRRPSAHFGNTSQTIHSSAGSGQEKSQYTSLPQRLSIRFGS